MPDISAKIDMTGLQRGLALAFKFSRRTPAQICNQTGLEVAMAAQKGTPFVFQDIIDAELSVIENPVLGKRGKPLKGKKFYTATTSAKSPSVPLAAMIIQARANPNSRYNQLTGGRYAGPSPFKGVSRAAGAAAMRAAIDKLVKLRHKSTNFLQAGWGNAIRTLLQSDRGRRPSSGSRIKGGEKLGMAKPAAAGSPLAYCVIENDIGGEGLNSASNNRALLEYGAPALQRAVDGEGASKMQHYLKISEEELAQVVNQEWK